MNRGKAADIHGVTVEHLLHGGNPLLQKVTGIINSIFRFGRVTEALSIGTLTPVFKNKGLSTDELQRDYHPTNLNQGRRNAA